MDCKRDPEPVIHTAAVEFYLIWTKNGRNPRRAHFTLEAAQAEVRRLAAINQDTRFFIVRALERVWVNEAPDRVAPPTDA